jgi:hypothetical protein
VIVRGLLFAAYAVVGAVLSYGALYLFSPMGFAIVAASVLLVHVLPQRLEQLGLLAGPGILLLAGDGSLVVPGAAIVALAVVSYALAGRTRCARAA